MVNMAYKERIRDKWTGFFFYDLRCSQTIVFLLYKCYNKVIYSR